MNMTLFSTMNSTNDNKGLKLNTTMNKTTTTRQIIILNMTMNKTTTTEKRLLILGLCCHLLNSLLKTMSYSRKRQQQQQWILYQVVYLLVQILKIRGNISVDGASCRPDPYVICKQQILLKHHFYVFEIQTPMHFQKLFD